MAVDSMDSVDRRMRGSHRRSPWWFQPLNMTSSVGMGWVFQIYGEIFETSTVSHFIGSAAKVTRSLKPPTSMSSLLNIKNLGFQPHVCCRNSKCSAQNPISCWLNESEIHVHCFWTDMTHMFFLSNPNVGWLQLIIPNVTWKPHMLFYSWNPNWCCSIVHEQSQMVLSLDWFEGKKSSENPLSG